MDCYAFYILGGGCVVGKYYSVANQLLRQLVIQPFQEFVFGDDDALAE